MIACEGTSVETWFTKNFQKSCKHDSVAEYLCTWLWFRYPAPHNRLIVSSTTSNGFKCQSLAARVHSRGEVQDIMESNKMEICLYSWYAAKQSYSEILCQCHCHVFCLNTLSNPPSSKMAAAARAEARRKAILAKGTDRLAQLSTVARGEDGGAPHLHDGELDCILVTLICF